MTEPQIPIEELARIAQLPAASHERQAAEANPRYRSLVMALSEFESPHETPPGAQLADAEARLATVLEREVWPGAAGGGNAMRAGSVAPQRMHLPGLGERLRGWVSALNARPAYALAVLAVVAGGVFVMNQGRDEPARVMRGTELGDSRVEPRIEGARAISGDGTLTLSWQRVPGADTYAVAFFGSELGDLASLPATPATRVVLRREALPAGLVAGADVLWQVTAHRGGVPLAQSPMLSARVP